MRTDTREIRNAKGNVMGTHAVCGDCGGEVQRSGWSCVVCDMSTPTNREQIVQLQRLLKEVLSCSTHALTPGSQHKMVNLHVDLLNDIVKALEDN